LSLIFEPFVSNHLKMSRPSAFPEIDSSRG
jgi:hypothetical protein